MAKEVYHGGLTRRRTPRPLRPGLAWVLETVTTPLPIAPEPTFRS